MRCGGTGERGGADHGWVLHPPTYARRRITVHQPPVALPFSHAAARRPAHKSAMRSDFPYFIKKPATAGPALGCGLCAFGARPLPWAGKQPARCREPRSWLGRSAPRTLYERSPSGASALRVCGVDSLTNPGSATMAIKPAGTISHHHAPLLTAATTIKPAAMRSRREPT